MASISTSQGKRVIQFIGADDKRRSIRLGRVPQRIAEAVKVKVEALVASSISGHAPDNETSRWVTQLEPKLANKLAAVLLIDPPVRSTLHDWLEDFIENRQRELKPGSVRKLEQTCDKLRSFFDGQRPLHRITRNDAALWRAQLEQGTLS